MTPTEEVDLLASCIFAARRASSQPIISAKDQALIEARKALVCATRKIDEALGRGGK
jgi:hypothetical protein